MPTVTVFRRREQDEPTPVPTSPMGLAPVDWHTGDYEGQLSVDVYQTEESLVIRSTIAGVKPEDLEVTLNNDVITIRGKRFHDHEVSAENYFYQECYWGGFSRSIVLPLEVRPDKVEASLKNGVLTVTLPKAKKAKPIEVKVRATEGT